MIGKCITKLQNTYIQMQAIAPKLEHNNNLMQSWECKIEAMLKDQEFFSHTKCIRSFDEIMPHILLTLPRCVL